MQEAQYAMQNQYSILAERIKNADQRIQELTQQLSEKSNAHNEASQKMALLEHQLQSGTHTSTNFGLSAEAKQELISILESNKGKTDAGNETEKNRLKELINIMRQSIQEFKMDLNQKINSSTGQQNELSAQIWQLLEINKKLSEETSMLSKALSSFLESAEKPQERQFTLTSLQKRS